MLRKIVTLSGHTTLGKALTTCVMASFLAGCGGGIGTFGGGASSQDQDLEVPDRAGNSGGINIPGFAFLNRNQGSAHPTGVVAAPNTDWGYVSRASNNFAGLVVADEPRAALMARNILSDGGTAADAATAAYFMLAATNPAAASLGGGGVCLVHDARSGEAQSIDFLPRTPAAGGDIAIPGAVWGFSYIHNEWGALPWRDLVDPAASVASSHPMSRTLARRASASGSHVQVPGRLRRLFTDELGGLKGEGDRFDQTNLAGTLGIIASRGAHDFYNGELAYRFIEEAGEDGAEITTLDMQSYRPNVTRAQVVELPGQIGWVPAGATGAGFFLPELTQKALTGLPMNPAPGTPSASTIQMDASEVLAESGIRGDLPTDFGSTSFAVTDSTGLTVACGMTMNGAFGTGDMGRSTGIIYSRSPSNIEFGLSGAFLAPIITTNQQGTQLHMAGVASGGPTAPASLLYTAINAPSMGLEEALQQNGSDATGTVNAISCGDGACRIGVDPRGSGLGAEALR